ncbi:MAG TPA: cupin domain-containing protein [Ignavibacteriaceae bacterium]|nr:cupin domain-containing protein [Ignavibacteriaceae bacterium]
MKTSVIAGFLILFFCVTLSFAQANGDNMIVKNINKLEWHPKPALPPGASSAVLYGDPSKGHYDFYGKFPAKYTVPMHWHSNDCMVTIIKGSMVIKRDGAPDVKVEQGGFFTLPAKMKYIAYTPKECIFQVHGEEPFDIFYANPKDDPRNK